MSGSTRLAISFWGLTSRSIQLWVGVILLIVGVVFSGIGTQLFLTEQAYRTQGVAVDATVVGKSIVRAERDKNPRTRYVVNYRFSSAEGKEIAGSAAVSVAEWEDLEAGRRFRVRYLSDAPESSRGSAKNEWIATLVFIAIGGVFALIGAGLTWDSLRAIFGILRVAREGSVAQGRVLWVGPTSTSINRVRQWQIHYEYRDLMGRALRGASQLLAPEEASRWREGDSGTIRYDRKRPEISVWMGNA